MPEDTLETEATQNEEQETVLPLQWDSFDHLDTHYVNHVMISHAGPEFYLIFGEVTPPFLKQRWIDNEELPDHVSVVPKVKIAISPHAMLSIAEAIQKNIVRFRDSLEEREHASQGKESRS